MIEFVLLFALGFLAAALLALIVAPVIQRRIVVLTERRIRASVPLSTAEIKAEKDMARAAYAADNARLSIDLRQNKEALSKATAEGSRLSQNLVALRAEKLAAEETILERDADIRELSAKMNKRDEEIIALTSNLGAAIRLADIRKQELALRDDKINQLTGEIEEMRIDVATLDTEAENYKVQINELRDERRTMRETLKQTETANHDLEFRLKREEGRLAELEEKLANTMSKLSDRENALDRRLAEVERFKQKSLLLAEELKTTKKELTAAVAEAKRNAGSARKTKATATASKPRKAPKPASIDKTPPPPAPAMPIVELELDHGLSEAEKIDRLRALQTALNERVMAAKTNTNDAALRREISTIAALMVELTVNRDGKDSPVAQILERDDGESSGREGPSLANRARDLISKAS